HDSAPAGGKLDAGLVDGAVWSGGSQSGSMAVSAKKFLTMSGAALLLGIASQSVSAQPRIDNVLVRMVPPGATGLVGVHMDQIKQTELYRKLLASQNLGQIDQFAAETGFDPRRDVRELLYATTARGSVMMARGTFHIHAGRASNVKTIRHGDYTIVASGMAGYCVLDSTLALAGEVPVMESTLDEWKS